MVLSGSNFVLERRVNRPAGAVKRTLRDSSILAPTAGFALGSDATLLVEAVPRVALHPVVAGYQSWQTTARLLAAGRREIAHLDIEISSWTPNSMLIQLRPLDRSPERWSAPRTRRYFELAHAGADRLERLLNEAPTVADNHAVATLVHSLPVRATWNWDHGRRLLDVEL